RLDLEIIFFEPMNDANVRQTSCAAASENQGNGLAVRRRHLLTASFHCDAGMCLTGGQQAQSGIDSVADIFSRRLS
ncbi:MAG: hypothetical protein ABSC47_01270, partial [Terracidiphilus sp.]